jgi:hypothetical protein
VNVQQDVPIDEIELARRICFALARVNAQTQTIESTAPVAGQRRRSIRSQLNADCDTSGQFATWAGVSNLSKKLKVLTPSTLADCPSSQPRTIARSPALTALFPHASPEKDPSHDHQASLAG